MPALEPRRARRSAALAVTAIALIAAACSSPSAASQPIATNGASAAPSMTPSLAESPPTEVTPMTTPSPAPATALALTSPSFREGEAIPAKFSCHGADVSPALAWTGVPADAKALVVFVDDPDGRDWVHWSVLDLPARDGELPEGVNPGANEPQQGTNDFRKVGYGGPCPPSGTHHYRFTLYALAEALGLDGHPDGSAVRAALKGAKVLARVTLTGTYEA